MLETTVARNDYVGNDTTPNYGYDFKIFSESHIKAVIRSPSGDVYNPFLNTDYSIDDVGEEAGGTLTLIDNNQAWMSVAGNLEDDFELVLIRNIPYTQATDFANQEEFFPEIHEREFDSVVMMLQRLAEEVKRCVKVSVEDYTEELILPSVADRAGWRFSV